MSGQGQCSKKRLYFEKVTCGPTDQPTDTARSRVEDVSKVAYSRLKTMSRHTQHTAGLKEQVIDDRWNEYKQGRIHGNPVADGWAGAVMRKPLGIQ